MPSPGDNYYGGVDGMARARLFQGRLSEMCRTSRLKSKNLHSDAMTALSTRVAIHSSLAHNSWRGKDASLTRSPAASL